MKKLLWLKSYLERIQKEEEKRTSVLMFDDSANEDDYHYHRGVVDGIEEALRYIKGKRVPEYMDKDDYEHFTGFHSCREKGCHGEEI